MGQMFANQQVIDQAADWPWVWAIRDAEILDWRRSTPSNEQHAAAVRQAKLPVEILPHLFLGDAKCARDMKRLRDLKITHILNAAGPAARGVDEDYKAEGIVTLEFDAEDEEGYQMLDKHLAPARAFIAAAKDAGGKCLVHCVAGISRSGVLVAAEAMLSERMSVLESVAHCRMRRSNAFLWNSSFQEQLVSLARSEGLLGPRPGETGSIVLEAPPPPPSTAPAPRKTAKDAFAHLT